MAKKPKMKDLLAKKEIEEGKKVDFEKGDFLALFIAGASVFLPAVLIVLFIIFLFILGWNAFFS